MEYLRSLYELECSKRGRLYTPTHMRQVIRNSWISQILLSLPPSLAPGNPTNTTSATPTATPNSDLAATTNAGQEGRLGALFLLVEVEAQADACFRTARALDS
jgi:hypothetical protein